MNYAKTDDLNAKKDELVTANDVIVLVDPKAIFFIAGTEMDFEVWIINTNLLHIPSHDLQFLFADYLCVGLAEIIRSP